MATECFEIEPSVTDEVAEIALRALNRDWPAGLTVYDVRVIVSAAIRQIMVDVEEEWEQRPTSVLCAAEVGERRCVRLTDVPWRDRNEPAYCWQHIKARAKAGVA